MSWLGRASIFAVIGALHGCGPVDVPAAPPPEPTAPVDAGSAETPCPGLGVYCGDRLGLDARTLYDCNEDVVAGVRASCAGACLHDPDGEQDFCDCPEGDGTYCGDRVGADGTRLYACRAGQLTEVAQCGLGCRRGIAAHEDACAPCPRGNGSYCGATVGGDEDKLYACEDGRLSVQAPCAAGPCKVDPAGLSDRCPACPDGDGRYCGGPIGLDANALYTCVGGAFTLGEVCPSGCRTAAAGTRDACAPVGLQCNHLQWWNAEITYGPYMSSSGRWDTDLRAANRTPIQLRHDSRLEKYGTYAWGWMPEFTDLVTGRNFRFLHLQPGAKYTTEVGRTYPAGTIVGLSGGASAATGYPRYSSGAHLCVQTKVAYRKAFPRGQDTCQ